MQARFWGLLVLAALLFAWRVPMAGAASANPDGGGSGTPTTGKVVYLTFDVEGPGAPQVLKVLRANHVHATMFVLGKWADAHPSLVRQMVADGDELGNHSYDHPVFPRLTPARARWEIAMGEAAVRRASGGVSPRPRFRFPYGAGQNVAWLRQIVAAQGYKAYYWTVDPQDWRGYSSATIARSVLAHSHNGSIILLHPASPGTPGAVQAIINGLRARGYRFAML